MQKNPQKQSAVKVTTVAADGTQFTDPTPLLRSHDELRGAPLLRKLRSVLREARIVAKEARGITTK